MGIEVGIPMPDDDLDITGEVPITTVTISKVDDDITEITNLDKLFTRT